MKLFRKHVPEVLQIERAECGAACLCMILGYYGKYVDISVIRHECNVTRDGARLSDMMAVAEKYGLEAVAYHCPLNLTGIKLPAIIYWKYCHFVVVEEVAEKYAVICDPASGRKKIRREEFDKYYSGNALQLTPKENFQKGGDSFSLSAIKKVKPVLKEDWRAFTYLGIIIVLLNLVGIIVPAMTSVFIDVELPALGYGRISVYFLIFFVLLVIMFGLQLIQKRAWIKFQRLRTAAMSSSLIEKLFKLPFSYFESRSHYKLVTRLCSVNILATYLTAKLLPVTLGLLFSVTYFVLLLYYSTLIGTVVILVQAAILALMVWIIGEVRATALNVSSLSSTFYSCIGQCIKLFETIKSTGREDEMLGGSMCAYIEYANAMQESKEWQVLLQTIPMVVPILMESITVVIGCCLIIDGKMSVGNVIACQSIAMSVYMPLSQFLGEYSAFQAQNANIRGLLDIMNEEEDKLVTRENEDALHRKFNSVELKNVSFGYNRKGVGTVLKDINLKVEAGKSVAIVGMSGSGKSSVLKIIEGLFAANEGEVLFNGVQIEDTNREAFNASVSVVSQEARLFDGTVKDNITLFDRTITSEEVCNAARAAEILSVLQRKKDGLNELIDVQDNIFSGGEVQRIMLARALVRKPEILIMDEATSELDTLVEEKIMRNINSLGITRIIAAHRLSTIRDADEIIVLDKGVIVERGTHEELLAKNSYYSRLVLSEKG